MPKVKVRQKTPRLDMNPMVDLAFLLVTFFMLTTTFKTEEPVTISPPSSQSEIKLPEKNIITITVDKTGRIFFSADGKFDKERIIDLISQRQKWDVDPAQREAFSLLSSFGVPMENIPEFLALTPNKRQHYHQAGIPCDSAKNELSEWIVMARIANPRYRVAIKGDQDTPYRVVKHIVNTLLENNVLRFNMITELEKELGDG